MPAPSVVAALSVVIPCFNEADNVDPCYREIIAELGEHDLELLFVDDGSTDATLERVRALAEADPRVGYLSFTRNFGFEAAFSAGYRYAGKPWVLHIDADQQFPAAEARKLISAAEAGNDAVFGIRTNRQDPLVRRWGTALFHFLGRRVLRMELPRGATAFRLVRADLARTVVDLRLGTPHFFATVPRLTDRYTVVQVEHRARVRGVSKVNLGFLTGHAIELFVGHTRRLLTIAATAAVLGGIAAVALTVAVLAGAVPGSGALAGLTALMACALPVLALVVRYLGVIGAAQPRPRLYYVRESSLAVDPAELLCAPPAVPPSTRAQPRSDPALEATR
ncbi:glycosyltransferase family 2 protein [Actinokineospora spheciospongiae]|uniref:glycosyltransferase family 2 protein n=1 Tax=Actinokineospora spheciospongiae TaxID=909613 RepID=UPI0004B24C3C|nr:glycosyltransferase family 2 protein [Actinokineospora spheciospongiae]